MSARRRLRRGDIVPLPFPFTDLSSARVRPALILADPRGDDITVAFITSGTAGPDPAAEHVLDPADPECTPTGLEVRSIVVLSKLATLHRRSVQRRLGHVGPRAQAAIDAALRHVLGLSADNAAHGGGVR